MGNIINFATMINDCIDTYKLPWVNYYSYNISCIDILKYKADFKNIKLISDISDNLPPFVALDDVRTQ